MSRPSAPTQSPDEPVRVVLSRGKQFLFAVTAVALPFVLVESVGRLLLHVGHARFLNAQGEETVIVEPQDGIPYCVPNLEGRLVAGEYDVVVATDATGFRVQDSRVPSAGSSLSGQQIDLVVVGDSVTFGWGVEFEETFGALLADRLATRLRVEGHDATVNLVNLGCPATGTRSQRMKLERYLASRPKARPTMVVWTLFLEHGFGGGNDLTDNWNRLQKEHRRQPDPTDGATRPRTHLTDEAYREVPRGLLNELKSWLSEHSVLYEVGMRTFGVKLRQFAPRNATPDQRRKLDAAWKLLGDEISAAGALVESYGGRVIFGYYPYLQDVVSGDTQALDQLIAVTDDSLSVVSLLDTLAGHSDSYAYPRDGHPSSVGHELVADVYEAPVLEEALAILATPD